MEDRYDVLVVGGGTAGCVLAARLSEDDVRRVCLLEAGPDYGPLAEGRWPAEILDPRSLAFTHDWGRGGEDERSLGARILGGSSAHNACMMVAGAPGDYDEWGPDSPAILLRSGIGPEPELRRLGLSVAAELPIGETLRDHCGAGMTWEPAEALQTRTAALDRDAGLFEAHAVVKAASRACPEGSWDVHLLPWTNPAAKGGGYETTCAVFHMKPASTGRVRLRSTDPAELPLVERGFLSEAEDLQPLLEGIELAREIAATEPLAGLLERELRPGEDDPETYVRQTIRNYFHPAGTCPIGGVVDASASVLGVDGLYVGDASIMPTLPRANTNLTTAAIAERVAELIQL